MHPLVSSADSARPSDPGEVDLSRLTVARLLDLIDRRIPQREEMRFDPGRNLTLATIASGIASAEQGFMRDFTDLAGKTLDLDPHLASCVLRRIGQLMRCETSLVPASGQGIDRAKAKEIADSLRLALLKWPGGFKKLRKDQAWSRYYGRAATEVQWSRAAQGRGRPLEWMAAASQWIHPRRLSLGPEREMRLADAYHGGNFYVVGENLEARHNLGRFLVSKPRLFNEYPEREGLAFRGVYWAFFKRFSARERMVLTELFGKPFKVLEQDKDVNVHGPELDAALDMVESLGVSTSAIRLAKGLRLNVPWPDAASGEIHRVTIEQANGEISKLVLGQSMTTEIGPNGSRAQAEVGEGQQDIVLGDDGTIEEDEMQEQLVDLLFELNYPYEDPAYKPTYRVITNPTSDRDKDTARCVLVARDTGLPVVAEQVYEVAGLRSPDEGERVIAYVSGVAKVFESLDELKAAQEAQAAQAAAATAALPGQGSPPGESKPPGHGAPPGKAGEAPPTAKREAAEEDPDPARAVDADVKRASAQGSPILASWASQLLEAAGPNVNAEQLAAVAASFDTGNLAASLFEARLRAALTGAAQAQQETSDGVELDAAGAALLLDAGDTPTSAIVEAFRARTVVARAVFDQLTARERTQAFTAADMATQAMLETAHAELTRALEQGSDLDTFRDRLRARFDSEGWTSPDGARLETIFRTNVMSAYGEGRKAAMLAPAVVKRRPFWQWRAVKDSRTRGAHAAMHNVVMRADDPAWETIGPPAGFNCRCVVRALSQEAATAFLEVTGTDARVQALPDRGFAATVALTGNAGAILCGEQPRHPKGTANGGQFAPREGGGDGGAAGQREAKSRKDSTPKGEPAKEPPRASSGERYSDRHYAKDDPMHASWVPGAKLAKPKPNDPAAIDAYAKAVAKEQREDDERAIKEYREFVPEGFTADVPEGFPMPEDGGTLGKFYEGGQPSPERRDVHDKLVEEHFINSKTGKPIERPAGQPRAIVMMGGPGAGKSTAVGSEDFSDFVTVDPDAVKLKLPEYQQIVDRKSLAAAAVVHDESSVISKGVRDRAIGEGLNLMIDGVGSGERKMVDLVNELRTKGYQVDVRMVHANAGIGLRNARDRAARTGRKPPPKFAADAYAKVPAVFAQIAGLADRATVYDRGTSSAIWRIEGGRSERLDTARVAVMREYSGVDLDKIGAKP
jgi:SPP1 gp7 family putative phage head morphogenesis protein